MVLEMARKALRGRWVGTLSGLCQYSPGVSAAILPPKVGRTLQWKTCRIHIIQGQHSQPQLQNPVKKALAPILANVPRVLTPLAAAAKSIMVPSI